MKEKRPKTLLFLQLTPSTGRFPRHDVPPRRLPIPRSTQRQECATLPCPAASAGREERQQHRRRRSTTMRLKQRRRKGDKVPRTQGTERGICRTGSCRGEEPPLCPMIPRRRGGGRARPPGRRPRKGEALKNRKMDSMLPSKERKSFFFTFDRRQATMAAVDNDAAGKQKTAAAAPGAVPALASQVGP